MIRVVSLFDGMSCGRVALERAQIPVRTYTASEIDKYAIQIAQKNYPSTIQLGDVRAVRQMAQYGLLGWVDLLIAGSPCQGFSFAGKQLAFDDPRSVLFFEFVWTLQALRQINPDIKFMLENVKMKKEHLDVITQVLGVEPVCINSALVSAQNRVRYYWANWKIEQPADRGIYLRDIIEDEVDEKYLIDKGQLKRLQTSTDVPKGFSKINPEKAGCMTARQYANWKGNFVTLPKKGYELEGIAITKNGIRPYKNDGRKGSFSEIGTIGLPDTKSACISATHAPKFIQKIGEIKNGGIGNRVYSDQGKSVCITADLIRRLTPVECERLQTLPDNYTAGISDAQRYKMLGNGWNVETVAHIFKQMPLPRGAQ